VFLFSECDVNAVAAYSVLFRLLFDYCAFASIATIFWRIKDILSDVGLFKCVLNAIILVIQPHTETTEYLTFFVATMSFLLPASTNCYGRANASMDRVKPGHSQS